MIINKLTLEPKSHSIKNNLKTTSFKSSFRSVYDDNFSLKYNTNTCFFKSDLNWPEFVDYLNDKYKYKKKVNVIDYACSTGEEPLSLIMMLHLKLKDQAEKFFPILAYDIDEENIIDAKRGIFTIRKDEKKLLEYNTKQLYQKYLKAYKDKNNELVLLTSRDWIDSKVKYKQSDIKCDIEKIPQDNTILLCRNFIPYLNLYDQKDLVKQISNRLNSTSVIVLGNFEISNGIDKLFEQEGFYHTKLYNVMEKKPQYKFFIQKLLSKLKLK